MSWYLGIKCIHLHSDIICKYKDMKRKLGHLYRIDLDYRDIYDWQNLKS